ncbi:hypothetical protein HPB48_022389 [Haemaphysalis longicornis]|uniref:Beta-ketoacyl synthase-like N-terminal domain-containing protein n=1 Tax=Haemaphysalis longicornis TaxID=44386 RepID=A0A9J6GTB8_HAELO|nr:hypothetical protein HPB48_022389 [Haemaphysalis longicornis]
MNHTGAGILGAPHHSGMIRDLSHFDAQFFNIHPKQAQALDPQVRLLLETSYEAILDAGYDPAELRGESVGVFIGNSGSETSYAYNVESKPDKFQLLGCTMTMLANRVSYYLGFHGVYLKVIVLARNPGVLFVKQLFYFC